MNLRLARTALAVCSLIFSLAAWGSAQELAAPASVAQSDARPQQTVEISSAKRALIQRYIEITEAKAMGIGMMDEYVKQMTPLVDQRVNQRIESDRNLTPAEKEEKKAAAAANSLRIGERCMAFLNEKLNFGQMIENISFELYNRHFTESELLDLVTFYESPTGRKVIKVMPQLMKESMALTVAKMETVMPDYYRFIDELVLEQSEELLKPASPSKKRRN